jgi:glycosyltransferase involved in cell wall biosynthesis
MRIAILSTSAVAVPPVGYGGTELFVFELSKMLTKRGHDVTVFATGDSRPSAHLRGRLERAVWPPCPLTELRHVAHAWAEIGGTRPRFDVVHVNQHEALPFAAQQDVPVVLTLHHDRSTPLVDFYGDFPKVVYVGISTSQVAQMPEVSTSHVVHHGLDPTMYAFGQGDGGYCAFLGRLAPEKGPHLAIDASRLADVPLRIGGVPHWVNMKFFDDEMEPRVDAAGRRVDYLGALTHGPKVELLRHAKALLFPIQWDEPFGLVMIEAMLVGTPVIAFSRGSVAEIVEDRVTGFLVNDVREMAARLRDIDGFDRARCRLRAEERWSSMRMARDYERVYADVVNGRARSGRASGLRPPRALAFEEVASHELAAPEGAAIGPGGLFTPFFKSA